MSQFVLRWLYCLILGTTLVVAGAASAEPGLTGRDVTFRVLTYDDPAQPIYQGALHRVRVAEGTEFGLREEGVQNELDVVPVLIDLSDSRIEVRYSDAEPGTLWQARFNGYVLTVDADCDIIESARVDPGFTNLPFDNKRVTFDGNTLYLNVSAQTHTRESRFAVDLVLRDCPQT